jgi:hypothetical protein
MNIPQKGFYIHYKHDPLGPTNNYTYEVVGVARNTEEKTYAVLYRPMYENTWMTPADFQSRPIDMFWGDMETENGTVPRFKIITDSAKIDELEKISSSMY